MMAFNFKSLGTDQPAECIERSGAAANVCGDGRTHDAELRKWTKTEYEAWTEHDVNGICQKLNTRRDRGITRAAKDGVDHKQHHDRDVAREHDCGKSPALRHHLRRSAHY